MKKMQLSSTKLHTMISVLSWLHRSQFLRSQLHRDRHLIKRLTRHGITHPYRRLPGGMWTCSWAITWQDNPRPNSTMANNLHNLRKELGRRVQATPHQTQPQVWPRRCVNHAPVWPANVLISAGFWTRTYYTSMYNPCIIPYYTFSTKEG